MLMFNLKMSMGSMTQFQFTQFPELVNKKKKDIGLSPNNPEGSDSEDEIHNLLPHQRQQKYDKRKIGSLVSKSECKGVWAMIIIVLWVSTVALIVMTAFGEFKITGPGSSISAGELSKSHVEYNMDDTVNVMGTNDVKSTRVIYHLPTDIIPMHYHLAIHVNMHKLTYYGHVSITIKIKKNTSNIILHSKKHNVVKTELTQNGHVIEQLQPEHDAKHDCLVMQTYHELQKGESYQIGLHFQGDIKRQLFGLCEGFCLNRYKTDQGETEYLASTNFEPNFARNVFPCFDEPELKATFNIVIAHDKDYKVISNMPVKKRVRFHPRNHLLQQHKETAKMSTYFQKTPRMSTYLVAFVVTKYTYIESKTKGMIPIRIYVDKAKIDMAKFASSIVPKFVNYFEKIFKTPFPLSKLDIMDFPEVGTTSEAWGLITIKHANLLYDLNKSNLINQENVALTLAHEIAYQWFGDLVTMRWWSDIWLKDGFAQYIQSIAVNHLYPEWRIMESFYYDQTREGLNMDVYSTSHPIVINVRSSVEINSVYDPLIYKKGASLIRMLAVSMGGRNFHNGLKNYFNKFAYGNTNTSDLWDSLNKESTSIDVRKMMNTWVYQQGYPVVTISHDEENSVLVAKQDVFMILKKKLPKSPYEYKWNILLRYIRQWYPKNVTWAWLKMGSATFPWRGKPGWFKFNHGHTGFYRVNYEDKNWKALIKQLHVKHHVLSAVDRAGLIDDSFHLARAGLLNYNISLDLSQYLEKETDYAPWMVAFQNFKYLENMLYHRTSYRCLKKYLIQLLYPLNELLGWEDKGSHLQRKLRKESLLNAINLGDHKSVRKAKEMFKKWRKSFGRYSIQDSLRYIVYVAGINYGRTYDWDFLWEMYQKEDNKQQRITMLMALGKSSNPKLLQRYLSYILNTKVSFVEIPIALASIAMNPVGREKTWNFIQNNLDFLHKRYGTLESVIKILAGSFSDQQKLNEVKGFFQSRLAGANNLLIKGSMEHIEQNIDFLRKYEHNIGNWLKSRKKCQL